jgi:hypothetical protein
MSYRTTEGSKFKVSTQEIGTRDLFSVKTLAGVSLSSYAYTDSIGSTDGIISFNFSKGLFDSVTITESLFSEATFFVNTSDSASAEDLLGVFDGITYTLFKNFYDNISITDNAFLETGFGRPSQDSAVVSENSVIGFGKSLSDSATSLESISLLAAFERAFTDNNSSSAIDNISLLASFNRAFADSSAPTESIAFTTTYIRGTVDGFVDSIGAPTDNAIVSQGWARYFDDDITVSDSADRSYGKGFRLDDSAQVTESSLLFAQGWGRPPIDNTNVSELIALLTSYNRSFNDSSSTLENSIFNFGKVLLDSSSILELASLNLAKPFVDSAVSSEALVLQPNKIVSDSTTSLENLIYTLGLNKNDIISPIENLTFVALNVLQDSSAITEIATLNYEKSTADSSSITEVGLISVQDYFLENYTLQVYVEKANYTF